MSNFELTRHYPRPPAALFAALKPPPARPVFNTRTPPSQIHAAHKNFSRFYYPEALINNKGMGIAPAGLSNFKNPPEYLATVRNKDAACRQKSARIIKQRVAVYSQGKKKRQIPLTVAGAFPAIKMRPSAGFDISENAAPAGTSGSATRSTRCHL